jgi:protein SCO1
MKTLARVLRFPICYEAEVGRKAKQERALATVGRRQRRRRRRAGQLATLVVLAALAALATTAWQRSRARHPIPVGAALPDFALLDDRGQPVTRAALAGQVIVFGFAFLHDAAHAGADPLAGVTDDLTASGAAVRPLTLTLDPDEDTSDHLASLAAALGVAPPRSLVTGPAAEVTALLDALDVDWRRLQAERSRYGSPLSPERRLVLVDGRGRIRDTYDGGSWIERRRLRAEIEQLRRAAD